MAAAANTTNNDDVHSTTSLSVGNAGSVRMDYKPTSNVRRYGGNVGNIHNTRSNVTNHQRTDISLDDSLQFHLESPQDIGTNTTTTYQFPQNMPMSVVSALKEALNGESYDSWKKSAKVKMKAMVVDEAKDTTNKHALP